MRALDSKEVKHICAVLLANAQMPAKAVNTVKEIVQRRTLRLHEALYPVFSPRFDENDSAVGTQDLVRAQSELGAFLSYVKLYPNDFTDDFKDKLFRMYYLLVLELELRKLGRTISAPETQSDDLIIRLSNLRDEIVAALGSWSNHDWQVFEEKLQELNTRFGFPMFSAEQVDREPPVLTDVPFASYVRPPPVSDDNTLIIEDAVNAYFKDNSLPLSPRAQQIFPQLEAKIARASENILSIYNLPPEARQRSEGHLRDIVIAYEFLVYVYQNVALAYSLGESLRAIFCSSLIELFVDVGSYHFREVTIDAPFEAVERMKSYIFYDEPYLNSQLIQQLEHIRNAAAQTPSGAVNESAAWHIDYLGEVLLR